MTDSRQCVRNVTSVANIRISLPGIVVRGGRGGGGGKGELR